MADVQKVILKGEFVELNKLLKFENIAASGGEANYLIADGLVRVNGEVEFRKRRKLYPGDMVEMDGICLVMEPKD